MFVGGGVVFVCGRPWTVVFVRGGRALSSMGGGGGVVGCGACCSWMGRGRLWALDIREWGSSVGGQRLWVVVVVYGGRLCGVSSVCGRGRPRGCRVLVGDGGTVVVVIPRRPGLWAFVARKVAVDVART